MRILFWPLLLAVIYLIPHAYAEEYFTTAECTVRGTSLGGVVKNAQTIRVLFGYYDRHRIERGDIVAYRYAGNKNPIIKIVKATAGDRFSLKEVEGSSGWNIIINDEIAANSQKVPYLLNKAQYRILSLYERDYRGIIPEDSYLIFGNRPYGTIDSSRFGLVHKDDILGKVETN